MGKVRGRQPRGSSHCLALKRTEGPHQGKAAFRSWRKPLSHGDFPLQSSLAGRAAEAEGPWRLWTCLVPVRALRRGAVCWRPDHCGLCDSLLWAAVDTWPQCVNADGISGRGGYRKSLQFPSSHPAGHTRGRQVRDHKPEARPFDFILVRKECLPPRDNLLIYYADTSQTTAATPGGLLKEASTL